MITRFLLRVASVSAPSDAAAGGAFFFPFPPVVGAGEGLFFFPLPGFLAADVRAPRVLG